MKRKEITLNNINQETAASGRLTIIQINDAVFDVLNKEQLWEFIKKDMDGIMVDYPSNVNVPGNLLLTIYYYVRKAAF